MEKGPEQYYLQRSELSQRWTNDVIGAAAPAQPTSVLLWPGPVTEFAAEGSAPNADRLRVIRR